MGRMNCYRRTAAHAKRVGGSAGLESAGFARAGRACMTMQRRDCLKGGKGLTIPVFLILMVLDENGYIIPGRVWGLFALWAALHALVEILKQMGGANDD